MKKLVVAALATLILGPSCASMDSQGTRTALEALGTIAGVAAAIYLPQAAPAIQAVCTASGTRQQSLMVEALQALWTDANKEQATHVVGAVNAIVGESKIMDGNMTEAQITEMQKVLGEVCCATGACAK